MELFTTELIKASEDLRYLLNRGYKRKNIKGLLKFVGDRYKLNKSQRNLLDRAVAKKVFDLAGYIIRERLKYQLLKLS